MKKVLIPLVVVAGFIIFFFLFRSDSREEKEIETIEENIVKEENKIDSLSLVLDSVEDKIRIIKEKEYVTDTLWKERIKEISILPLDSATSYFKEKLKEYEKKFNP